MRKEFDRLIKEKSINCTLPWIESMRGSLNYSVNEIPTCKTKKDFHLANWIGENFALYASAYKHPNCVGNHQIQFNFKQTMLYTETIYNKPD